jgi:hypothetical protein
MVIRIASGDAPRPVLACVICGGRAQLGNVCIGLVTDIQPNAFACGLHLLEPAKRIYWITGWADFNGDGGGPPKGTTAPGGRS